MKATLEIPDELYAMVKARAALEGRTLRSVAIELLSQWVRGERNEGRQEKHPHGAVGEDQKQAYGDKPQRKLPRRKAAPANQAASEAADDPLKVHRDHLRNIMRHPRAIDEIAGVLTGPAPDIDMATMRAIYEERLVEEWKRRHT